VETLRAAAGGDLTGFSWRVRVTDFELTSGWSATCRFVFDPTRTAAPRITPPAGPMTRGRPATFTITGPASGPRPVRYHVQLNSGPPVDVDADTDGNASATVTPRSFTNTLAVTGLSRGGNFGETTTLSFYADTPPDAADADLNGDGRADLLAVGGVHGLSAGLWLVPGGSAGASVPATDIGARGNGTSTDGSPEDFTGAQVITGRFTGDWAQDVLAYYPGGPLPGKAIIIRGNGDGSVLQAQLSGNSVFVDSARLADEAGFSPLHLANAGDSRRVGASHPDLIGVSGDDTGGYFLTYYPNNGRSGAHIGGTRTAVPTPTGGTDWNNWRIATAQLASGTAMFLWNRDTGALRLWTDLTFDPDTLRLTYTGHQLSTTWNRGADVTPYAADIDADGDADLWTVGAGRVLTTWLVTDLTPGAGAITAQPSQTIGTPAQG
jgi:hypothetical protein